MRALILLFPLLVSVLADPIVFLIRHGEKPEKGDGLSAQGKQRAQCLREVFGSSSEYNIGYIMAQKYKKDGSRKRPYDTVLPVATDLGLTVDISCDRDDPDCVKDSIKDYDGEGNVLISWEHDALHDIVDELGAGKDAPKYPDDAFNLIWTDPPPYNEITDVTNENCPGLDDVNRRAIRFRV